MADKTYRMNVGLSNGSSLNAGNFTVPGATITFSWQYTPTTTTRKLYDILNSSPYANTQGVSITSVTITEVS